MILRKILLATVFLLCLTVKIKFTCNFWNHCWEPQNNDQNLTKTMPILIEFLHHSEEDFQSDKNIKNLHSSCRGPRFSSTSSAITKEHTERLRAGGRAHLETRAHPSDFFDSQEYQPLLSSILKRKHLKAIASKNSALVLQRIGQTKNSIIIIC